MNKLTFAIVALWLAAGAQVMAFSEEGMTDEQVEENRERTDRIIKHVKAYMAENDAYVALMSRRGAGSAETGVSDTDGLDLTGMAHTGFLVRNGYGKDADYVTFNLVRRKGAKKDGNQTRDLSEPRIWNMSQFFIGSFEKDAIVFLPEKKTQLKLWNLLRANGSLELETRERALKCKRGKPLKDIKGNPRVAVDQIIKNGAFTVLNIPEYNLLSDYADSTTTNCNEHLIKTYLGVRDHWQHVDKKLDDEAAVTHYRKAVDEVVEASFTPSKMVLSRMDSTFAFTQNIRFGERHEKAPSLFGLKLKRERFSVVSVDNFCNPENQELLGWADFKVFREAHDSKTGWTIEDQGKAYVKVNRLSGRKNRIKLR